MADEPTTHDTTQPTGPVLWSVSMVVGPNPGVHILADSKQAAEAEYRKRFGLAANVELWAGKVP